MNIPTKSVKPEAKHLAYRNALMAAIAQHGQTLEADELLALTSHFVGQLVALQDQRVMTPAMAMEIVATNIQQGNRDAIEPLMTQTGGNA